MKTYQEQLVREVSQTPKYVGKGKAFGTFGELLQGRLASGENFLVTLPIALYSYATFTPDSKSETVTVLPSYKHKSRAIANMILEYYTLPRGGNLIIKSSLPLGKGLASSSADLVATARAIASCFRKEIPLALLQTFMREIEPSDGVMYPAIVSFYHQLVRLREFLGSLPSITIVAIDEGGELDTIQFNKLPKPYINTDELEYQHLLDKISIAMKQKDLAAIGRIATRSAVLNQKLAPKQSLEDVIAICEEIQGLGVVVAHSGTCLGILLSPEDSRYGSQLGAAQKELSQLTGSVAIYHTLDFG